MLKLKRTKDKRKSGTDPGGEIPKGSTCGPAVGAKLGRTKGNKQKAEYRNLEGRHERSGRRERGKRRSESGSAHGRSHCEADTGREGKEETEAE